MFPSFSRRRQRRRPLPARILLRGLVGRHPHGGRVRHDEPFERGPEPAPPGEHVVHGFAPGDHDLPREEAQEHHGGRVGTVDQPGEHLALVRAVQGHLRVHGVQVQAPPAHRYLHVRHHVLHVARQQAERVPGDALLEQARDEQGRVHALVPGAAPRDHQLPAREQQRRAVGLVQAHRDGRELVLVVKRERQHLVDPVQVQHGQGARYLGRRHYVVHGRQGQAWLHRRARLVRQQRAVLALPHVLRPVFFFLCHPAAFEPPR